MTDQEPRTGALATHRDRLPSTSQYELLVRLASGGMATVYVGRRNGIAGFSREVAIKRAHAHLLEDPAFGKMMIAEAKIAARIHHPNVVAVQAVEVLDGELVLIMDYVEGASLSELVLLATQRRTQVSPAVCSRILLDACAGLHAAHNAVDEHGSPLGIVHRDVSPQNILIGIDGVARVSDFGIAKSSGQDMQTKTTTGALKGKVGYMAPEYIETGTCNVRSDVYGLGVVAWEAFSGRRLFRGTNEVETYKQVLTPHVSKLSSISPVLEALDGVVMRALARDPSRRFDSAEAFANALETTARRTGLLAPASEVAAAVQTFAGSLLARRRELVRVARKESERSIRVVGRTEATGTMGVDRSPGEGRVQFDDVATTLDAMRQHMEPMPELRPVEKGIETVEPPQSAPLSRIVEFESASVHIVTDHVTSPLNRHRGWSIVATILALTGIVGLIIGAKRLLPPNDVPPVATSASLVATAHSAGDESAHPSAALARPSASSDEGQTESISTVLSEIARPTTKTSPSAAPAKPRRRSPVHSDAADHAPPNPY